MCIAVSGWSGEALEEGWIGKIEIEGKKWAKFGSLALLCREA